GSRQTGKTTLVQHILKNMNAAFLNFDVDVDKQRFAAAGKLEPSEAVKLFGNPKILVIDEAHRYPETGRIVKGWYDKHTEIKIILLGSSSLNILDQSAESLTGRNVKLHLPPLIFEEILQAQSWSSPQIPRKLFFRQFKEQVDSLVLSSIVYGGYPEAATTGNKEDYLLNLTSDFLLKDIFQLGLIKNPETIKRLLLLLAHQVGSEASISELANNLDTSRPTIEKYLDLLERTYVIFRLPAFSSNLRKEITKNQKIFCWDTGVRHALLKEFSLSPMRSDIGKLWENWVISEFAKKNLLSGNKANLYFWRTRDGSEIDLVIKHGGKLEAFEIKWSGARSRKGSPFTNRYNVPVIPINKDKIDIIHKYFPL
ncbi:MAG: ATP-binding protein, partial [Candidatus Margulisiibacteriota bacterium]